MKLVARFNLLEMVRHFRLERKRSLVDGLEIDLWRATGVASSTDTYGVLKPGFNF